MWGLHNLCIRVVQIASALLHKVEEWRRETHKCDIGGNARRGWKMVDFEERRIRTAVSSTTARPLQ